MIPRSHHPARAIARDALVLCGAALLAASTLAPALRDRGWSRRFGDTATLDADAAELRLRLRPGERIGVLVPAMDADTERAFWFSAQYAVAPAIVVPVRLRDCLEPEPGPTCRATDPTQLAVLRPDARTVAVLERTLGVAPVAWAGGVLLLGRTAP